MESRCEVGICLADRGGLDVSLEGGPGNDQLARGAPRPARLIAWSGRTLGIRAFHVWRLEEDGTTLVQTEESYEGLVARVLRRPLRKTLDKALTDGTRYLKVEAEKAPPPP